MACSKYLYSHFLRLLGLPGEVSFLCPQNQGAALCLPLGAKREDTEEKARFRTWIITHIDRWFAWAQQLELGVDRMEDIILVTGTHRTGSCANVAFLGGQKDAQASLGMSKSCLSNQIDWHFSPRSNRGAVLCCGPSGEV